MTSMCNFLMNLSKCIPFQLFLLHNSDLETFCYKHRICLCQDDVQLSYCSRLLKRKSEINGDFIWQDFDYILSGEGSVRCMVSNTREALFFLQCSTMDHLILLDVQFCIFLSIQFLDNGKVGFLFPIKLSVHEGTQQNDSRYPLIKSIETTEKSPLCKNFTLYRVHDFFLLLVERKAHGLLYHCCWCIELAFSELNYLHFTPLASVWKNTKSVIAVLLQFMLFHAAEPLLFVS